MSIEKRSQIGVSILLFTKFALDKKHDAMKYDLKLLTYIYIVYFTYFEENDRNI